jgi:hypothetical protein
MGTCRPRAPAARPSPPTTVSTSPSREMEAASAPSRRTARPVSRWRAREPSAVGSSRRTAASRPSREPASGSGAVTVGSFRRGVPGTPGPASGPSIPAPGSPVGTGSSWPGRAPSGGFREAPAHRREGGGPGTASAGASSTGQATSSSVACRERAGPGTGHHECSVLRSVRRAPMARAGPVRDPGDEVSLSRVPGGPVSHPADGSGGRSGVAAHVCASLEGPRAALGSRRGVEARTVVRRSRAAAGVAPSEVSQGGRCRPAESEWLGDRVVGRGHPGKGATVLGVLGACGGRRPAAGCCGRALLLGMRRSGP